MEKEERNMTIKSCLGLLLCWANECKDVGEEGGPLFVVRA